MLHHGKPLGCVYTER